MHTIDLPNINCTMQLEIYTSPDNPKEVILSGHISDKSLPTQGHKFMWRIDEIELNVRI